MSKIKELLDKYRIDTDHYADQQWYDEDVEKALIEYAIWYTEKCIEELDGGRCIIEFNKLTHISSDNSLKRIIQLPPHE